MYEPLDDTFLAGAATRRTFLGAAGCCLGGMLAAPLGADENEKGPRCVPMHVMQTCSMRFAIAGIASEC